MLKYEKRSGNFLFGFIILFFVGLGVFLSNSDSSTPFRKHGKSTYVKPSVTRSGQYRKGHYRKSYSTDKNAYKHQQQSRSYYQRKGKYMRKKKSD
jgi:hypothetical protein